MSDVYNKLVAPFDKRALSKDLSRGYNNAMTSIKAHFMVERLNEVLGVDGWETKYQFTSDERGVVCFCELSCTIGEKVVTKSSVGACPFDTKKKDGTKIPKILGDVYKSAMTDSLGKAASHFGVGNDVFKGLVDASTLQYKDQTNSTTSTTSKPSTSNKPSFRKPLKSTPVVEETYGDDI